MAYKEFSLITRYFNRIKVPSYNVEIGIGDDCALLNIPEKQMLAVSTDTLVCGRHFLPNINPRDLAYKSLAVNISDLAAIGAKPAWIILSLTLPEIDEIWLEAFSDTLFEQLNYYNLQLVGGDTTSGPLSITLTIYGFIPQNELALKRSGARPGDYMYVTGTLGDSAAGLAILKNQLKVQDIHDKSYLIQRHLRPTPRILHSQVLRGYASSAIDLSDGLLSDLQHILKASKVGAYVNLDFIPISNAIRRNIESDKALELAISGGEDYELFFTMPELLCSKLNVLLGNFDLIFTCIGQIVSENKGLQFFQNGIPLTINWKGYDHFP